MAERKKNADFTRREGGKVAEDKNAAWEMQEQYAGKPHGWIQWKGTDVCMDIYCKCGVQFHIDADFAYHVKCPICGTVYFCNGHVEMIELKQEPDSCVVTED